VVVWKKKKLYLQNLLSAVYITFNKNYQQNKNKNKSNHTIRTQAEIDAEPRFLECFKTFFEKAAGLTNLKPGTINNMKECNVVLRVEFPIKVIPLFLFLLILVLIIVIERAWRY
jgi:hypothetical protein